MKDRFSHIGLAKLCGWFGITRQAYYKNQRQSISSSIEEELIIKQVRLIRQKHPRIGVRKLFKMLQSFFTDHDIKMGRDGLFDLLSGHHLLVRKRKRKIYTTNSFHWLRKYPNLIKGVIPDCPNQIWVSDITYWKINTGEHLYISMITDVYSHQIVGYHVAETLETIESVQALNMALSALDAESHIQLTHHSDRGVQYCSQEYVKLLHDYNIRISMTENGDPLENSVAERINGIIKDEYLDSYEINNLCAARQLLASVIDLYNKERPHFSISMLTPEEVHQSKNQLKTKRLWKNYYKKPTTFVNPI
jgi:transposase InsO family protein